jgi:hypothetical protein
MKPRRVVAAVSLVTLLGCQSFQSFTPGPPPPDLDAKEVRVHSLDGSRAVLDSPRREGTRLIGTTDGSHREIALDSIAGFEVKKVSVPRTALLVGGIVLMVYSGLYVIGCYASVENC